MSISFAQNSNLIILNEEGERFFVFLNGEKQNDEARTIVKIADLTAPSYKCKIIFINPRLGQIDKTIYLKPGIQSTYTIKKNNNDEWIIKWQEETEISYSNQENNYDNKFREHHNDRDEHHNQQVYEPVPGYTGAIGCTNPMEQQNFQNVKQTISSKNFEESKLTIAKQVLNNNCLLTSQIKEILLLFNFEDTKLEFAKYAYGYTYDIGNYYMLNDAFQFETSINELNKYISNKK